jgi:hypothetical protein
VTIDEFIEEGSGCLDATGFRDARRSLNGRLWEKLESINAEEYPDLREAVQSNRKLKLMPGRPE